MHQVSTRQRTEQFSGVCELLLRKNTLLESESVGEFQKLGADQFESLGSGDSSVIKWNRMRLRAI